MSIAKCKECGRTIITTAHIEDKQNTLCYDCEVIEARGMCPISGNKGYVKEEKCHCFCCGEHNPTIQEGQK